MHKEIGLKEGIFITCLIITISLLLDYFCNSQHNIKFLLGAVFITLPWVAYFRMIHLDKKDADKQRMMQDETQKTVLNTIKKEKLILFRSMLYNKKSIIDLILKSNIGLDFTSVESILRSEIEIFELSLKDKLFNQYGTVQLKQDLLNNNLVDLSVIDTEIENMENNLPVSASDITDFVNKINYQTKKDEKFFTECKRNDLNSYYETQNQELNDMLNFGCSNVCKINFEDEIKRLENLAYYNEIIDAPFELAEFEQRYKSCDTTGLEFYHTRVLNNSIYPSFVKKDFELFYKKEAKTLIVDYCLPNVEDIPAIKQINKQLNEVGFKEKEINALYENVLYQTTLRSIFELFHSDEINALESIVFNGWLEYVDKADGNEKTNCILSMQAKKDEFMEIKLENVEPKTCFKKFKGISCNNLSTITPVKPILRVNTTDKRFIESYEVMAKLSQGENLAMMDWKDFENLVREIFEKEFSVNGGEVKITQSSHDGGVDAVAYNKDPLLGGKIVIQAKRYTNVVGVSAVRDLYGTILNEGAVKGILITTSHFGVESYDFAKDKPITLLEGSNLLHLMEKHGHKARIDIQEAKAMRNM